MPSFDEIETKFFVAGQMDAQGHEAEKRKIGSGGPVLAMSRRLLIEARAALVALYPVGECPKCGGLPPGESAGAGDLCYRTPAVERGRAEGRASLAEAEDKLFAANAILAFLRMGVCPSGYDRGDLQAFSERLLRERAKVGRSPRMDDEPL